jgi:putative Mg2+ transporter-C (MgtC) family protein
MPLTLTWHEIALRLALSVVAGGLVGLDRGEHGRPSGLRTTLLVCLAAAIAMIQTNLLLAVKGRTADSFVMLDLMRLPLGILTGMGFIGGGAILRRESLVLGLAATALGMLVLSGLRWVDHNMKQEQHGTLYLTTERDDPKQDEIRATVQRAGYKISVASVAYVGQTQQRELEFKLQWHGMPQMVDSPPFLRELISDPRVVAAQWKAS